MIRFGKGRLGPKKSKNDYDRTYRKKQKEKGCVQVSIYLDTRTIERLRRLQKRLFRHERPLIERTRSAVVTESISTKYFEVITSTTQPAQNEVRNASAELRENLKREGKKHVHGH